MVEDWYAPARVADQADAVKAVIVDRHAWPATGEEVFGRDEAPAAGQPPLGQLKSDIADQIVRRRPGAALWSIGHLHIIRGERCRRGIAVGIETMRIGMIAAQRPREIEGRLMHAERREQFALHGRVIGIAEFLLGEKRMARDIAGRRGHQVVILIGFPERRGRLHRRQQGEGVGRRRIGPAVQPPFVVAARHPGAGADEVAHLHPVRRRFVAEPEAGIGLHHRLGPGELPLIDQTGEQQGRQRFGIRRDHEQRMRIDRRRIAQPPYAEPAFEQDPAMIDHRDRSTGYAEFVHGMADERLQRLDPRRIEFGGRGRGRRCGDQHRCRHDGISQSPARHLPSLAGANSNSVL